MHWQFSGNGRRSSFSNLKYTGGCVWTGGRFPGKDKYIVCSQIKNLYHLSSSKANTTERCHTSKLRILTPCNLVFRVFLILFSARPLNLHVIYDVIWTGWELWHSKESACTSLPKASSLVRTQVHSQLAFYEQAPRYKFVYCFCRDIAFRFRTADKLGVNHRRHFTCVSSSSPTIFINILTMIMDRKCLLYFIFESSLLTKKVSARTCSSYSFGCSTGRCLLSNGQLYFSRYNLLCDSV